MEHWKITETADNIVISCSGHDMGGKYAAAATKFAGCVARRSGMFRVIADLREMTGYESAARRAWQEAFQKHRRLMSAVVIVGAPSRGIRMGAAVVAAVAGVPVRFVNDWSEIND
jgi:hypothetical protein